MFFHQQHGCPENRNSRFSSLLFYFLSIQTRKNIYKIMIKLKYPQQKFKAKLKPTSNLRERIGVIEREYRNKRKRIHHCHCSKPPRHHRQSPNHHAITVDLQSIVAKNIFFLGFVSWLCWSIWVDHDFVYIFASLDVKKMK